MRGGHALYDDHNYKHRAAKFRVQFDRSNGYSSRHQYSQLNGEYNLPVGEYSQLNGEHNQHSHEYSQLNGDYSPLNHVYSPWSRNTLDVMQRDSYSERSHPSATGTAQRPSDSSVTVAAQRPSDAVCSLIELEDDTSDSLQCGGTDYTLTHDYGLLTKRDVSLGDTFDRDMLAGDVLDMSTDQGDYFSADSSEASDKELLVVVKDHVSREPL